MAAPRVSDNPAVQQHYAAQLAFSAALTKAISGIRVAPTSDHYIEAIAALTHELSYGAIGVATDYYVDVRELAGVETNFQPVTIDPVVLSQIEVEIDAAVVDLNAEVDRFAAEIEAQAQKALADAASNDLFANIAADPSAKRWARVTRPGACAFCLMLATRGAVYRDESTANFRPHARCQCDVEPLFGDFYEPPAHIRSMQSLWSESTGDVSGKDKFNAFRRAVYAQNKPSR